MLKKTVNKARAVAKSLKKRATAAEHRAKKLAKKYHSSK